MNLTFSNEVFYWRGPSPFHFVTIPQAQSLEIKAVSKILTYGWGVIPVSVKIGQTEWTTSLFPKEGLYLVPIKEVIRRAEAIELGDTVQLNLSL